MSRSDNPAWIVLAGFLAVAACTSSPPAPQTTARLVSSTTAPTSASPVPPASSIVPATTSPATTAAATTTAPPTTTTTVPEPRIYRNDDPAFTLVHPSSWTVTSGAGDTAVSLQSPLDGQDDPFRETVTVLVERLPNTDLGLVEYVDVGLDELGTVIDDLRVVRRNEDAMLGSLPAVGLTFTGLLDGRALRWRQLVLMDGTTAYVLTLVAGGDPERAAEGWAIVSTFTPG